MIKLWAIRTECKGTVSETDPRQTRTRKEGQDRRTNLDGVS